MNGREAAVSRVMNEATERLAGVTWDSLSPCRCWTEPARIHPGHCCMEHADQTCHQNEGMTALKVMESQ